MDKSQLCGGRGESSPRYSASLLETTQRVLCVLYKHIETCTKFEYDNSTNGREVF